jgi:MFS transporter, DHA1 family, multidrug resistance protein
MARRDLALPEFVALMALIFATLAFSIDAMLPAFPAIAAELSPDAPNTVQLILSLFMAGMGIGTFFTGPLSDAFGRLPVIYAGFVVYLIGSVLAHYAPSLETLLAARFLQGLGASGPRIVSMALMRDLHEGRRMAQITSFVMTVFLLVPAVAPWVGQLIISGFGWRAIFAAYVLFALFVAGWIFLRQAETHPRERRRPFTLQGYLSGAKDVLSRRDVVLVILVLSLGFGQMFALLSATQQIYDQTYDQGDNFPNWFMATAAFSAVTTVLNASLVMRLGMRRIALGAYLFQIVFSALVLIIFEFKLIPQPFELWLYFAWSVSLFFMAGLTFGNLNALALQPLGHMAGMGASLVGAISTVLAVMIAAPISLSFAGTPIPMIIGTVVCSTLAYLLLRLVGTGEPQGH